MENNYTKLDLLAYNLYKTDDRHSYLSIEDFTDTIRHTDDFLFEFVKYYYDKAIVKIRKDKLKKINDGTV